MNGFEEGLKLVEQCCGNDKDNVISLATIAVDPADNGSPRPVVRDVDAFYEDGAFYIVTSAKSNKTIQIEHNGEAAFAVHFEGIYGSGIGRNLGWALKPENAALREKLRRVFAKWYDGANNEQDENCVYLAIELTKVVIFREEGKVQGCWER